MNKWNNIPDANVRHVWHDPEKEKDFTVEPSFYANAGTPITEDSGEDCLYVRTEVAMPATFNDLMRIFLAFCPQGEMGEDQNGQLVFYTNMSQTADGQLQAFENEEER